MRTLRHQLRVLNILLVFVPSLLIMVIYTVGQISIAKEKHFELIGQQVEFHKRLIETWASERADNIKEMSRSKAIRSLDSQLIKEALALKQEVYTDFNSLSYIDKNGMFQISTLSKGIQFASAAGTPYFEKAKEGSDYISDVVLGRNSGQPIINFSSPVYDEQGRFQGAILGSVTMGTLESLLQESWIGQTGEILLVNRQGLMLIEPRYKQSLIDRGLISSTARMNYKLNPDALNSIRLGESGTATWTDYLGNKVMGAYVDVPERNWTLIGKINEAEVLRPIENQLVLMGVGTFLIILLILPIATLITNRIKQPVDWLIDQSKLVAKAEYPQTMQANYPKNTPQEIKLLCETFVRMSRQIEASINLLKANEAKLEAKVQEIQDINATLEEEIMERHTAQAQLEHLNDQLESKVQKRTSQLQEKTLEIQRIAYTDALTELPNRVYLQERLAEELAEAHRGLSAGAVFFIDLDDLKMINDTFGHKYGDMLIMTAGKRIVEAVGERAFVSRIGGDEFIVILPGKTNRDRIAVIADRVLGALNQNLDILGICVFMSASIGIAVYPDDGLTTEEICKNADNAMYAAKKAGRRCWRLFTPVMLAEIQEKIKLISSLRQATEKGEFILYYQPQFSITDGTIVGFEALIRWKSPMHGWVLPNRFIPLAEQHGLIQEIGAWVLSEACSFARRLHESGWGDIRIAVNVSPHQLCGDGFINCVRKVLYEQQLSPSQLEIEITENALMDSLEVSSRTLDVLRSMGVRLSLDDFGTGYSSLTYLQRLPVHKLKIDKAFIDMIIAAGTPKAIIRTIIEMAHSLGLTVVAEGVETEEQLRYLAQCQCDLVQGFIKSRPLSEDDAFFLLLQPKRMEQRVI